MPEIVKLKRIENSEDLPLPSYATAQSAGVDLSASVTQDVTISPNEVKIIPTGIAIALPKNMEAQVRPRSGLAAKHGVTVLNSPGTIDADYRGEIKVILINHSKNDFTITRGMRIAQMVIAPYTQVSFQQSDSLDETDRGKGGFGSTGH